MSTAAQVKCDIKNPELADAGKRRIEWANQSMPVLQIIRKEFIKNAPLKGIRISACLHVTTETANLAITLRDDGADFVTTALTKRTDVADGVLGGTEETTTGVIRLRAMAKEGVLRYPIVAVNDADTKHLFDNRYGTGQSTIDGIIRATNFLLAGSKFV